MKKKLALELRRADRIGRLFMRAERGSSEVAGGASYRLPACAAALRDRRPGGRGGVRPARVPWKKASSNTEYADRSACANCTPPLRRRERLQRRAAAHAGDGNAHRVAVAHQVDAAQLGRQVGMRRREVGDDRARPRRASRRSSRRARCSARARVGAVAAERPVGGEHGRRRRTAACSGASRRHSRGRRCRRRTLSHDGGAPGRSSSGGVELQVGDQPRRVAHRARRPRAAPAAAPRAGARRRTAAWRGRRARAIQRSRCCGRRVPGVDARPRRGLRSTRERDAAAQQPLAERRGEPLGEPGVALGPGQDAVAAVAAARLVAGRAKAVPAGEVVQPGPGRDLRRAGAVVVAAAVVEVPAQRRRGEAAARRARRRR